uniref:Voltage-gated ClC-type chloride channel ClcB n=1 Tax=uncultured Methanosarcinales archaeon TaxID=183757 RepID=A0A7H1KNU0_9EURY|nr:voltage-gated ClC-type chloride channel ClcB [uncultured Methanosarcinales archaeon]
MTNSGKISSVVARDHLRKLNFEYIEHWVPYSILIGLVAGMGAVFFYYLLSIASHHLLGGIGHYYPPPPGGEADIFTAPGIVPPGLLSDPHTWILVLLPAIGGLIAGIIIYRYAPEAEGHGTDAVIDAYHQQGGFIRKRVPVIKTFASAITIGTGGSAGREGPIAQIGAGFGSFLADRLKLDDKSRRMMLLCGAAGGIGSIFRSPLGGALFTISVLYKRDSEFESLVPAFISSIIAYSVFCSFFGWGSLFATPEYVFEHPLELIFDALLGLFCGLAGILYINVFYGMRDIFRKLGIRNYLKPAIGGLLLGILALVLQQSCGYGYDILGMGYGIIQSAIDGNIAFEILVLLVLAKIIATSFTISSGGSGGVFAPSLVIGAMLGGAFGMAAHALFPGVIGELQSTSFVLIGMAALLSGVARVPIAAIVMVSELSGNYNLLPPLMFASTIAYLVTSNWTIYEKQVSARVDSPAHREELTIDILENASVSDAMSIDIMPANPTNSVQTVLNLITRYGHIGYPVLDDNRLVGVVTFKDAERVPVGNRESVLVEQVMAPATSLIVTYPDESLEDALRKLVSNDIGRLPVVDRDDRSKILGIVTKSDIIRLHAQLR